MKVEVSEVPNGWMAWLPSLPTCWALGDDQAEAVGRLILERCALMGLTIHVVSREEVESRLKAAGYAAPEGE